MRKTALVAALLLAVSACGGDDAPERAQPATTAAKTTKEQGKERASHVVDFSDPKPSERNYIGVLGEWVLASAPTTADCEQGLTAYAGKPPTRRMRKLAAEGIAACEAFKAGRKQEGQRRSDAVIERIYGYEFHWGENRGLVRRGGRTSVSRIEPRFSDAATKLVGKKTEVRCWSKKDWKRVAAAGSPYDEDDEGAAEIAGFVSADDQRIHLAPYVCEALVDLVYGKRRRSFDGDFETAFAVVALAHEARHRKGTLLESVTECHAMQDAAKAAQLLGQNARYGRGLAEFYWEEVYPENSGPYFTEDCRDGGKLDLHPQSSVWP